MKKITLRFILLFLVLTVCNPLNAFSEEGSNYSDKDLKNIYCFEEAGREYNISPLLLWAIAKTETDFNPTAVNRKNADGSIDVGMMQINSYWAEKLGEEFWQAQEDPCYNIRSGAYVLANCFERYGKNWVGIGCYNASTTSKQIRYTSVVFSAIKEELSKREKLMELEDMANEISSTQVASAKQKTSSKDEVD